MERNTLDLNKAAFETIPLDDSVDRRELFGGMDQNLRNIEDMFGVTIIQRSDGLLIKGGVANTGVEHAAAILREMIETIRKGEVLDQQKVGYITDLEESGISYNRQTEETKLDKEIICFTHDGKPLRPKTIGQRDYVKTIRNRDIVFGIGPAGTGKTYIAVAMAVQAFKTRTSRRLSWRDLRWKQGRDWDFCREICRRKLTRISVRSMMPFMMCWAGRAPLG